MCCMTPVEFAVYQAYRPTAFFACVRQIVAYLFFHVSFHIRHHIHGLANQIKIGKKMLLFVAACKVG